MKKLFILFGLFLGIIIGAQTQQEIESIVKDYFEKKFVPNSFKDPYSYELKNISSAPISQGEALQKSIKVERAMSETQGISKKIKKPYVEKLNELTSIYDNLSEEKKNEIIEYLVTLDTYGANSYGNKVFKRYFVIISADGSNIKKVY